MGLVKTSRRMRGHAERGGQLVAGEDRTRSVID